MSWYCIPTHPWHQSAATLVNITRCSKYSQVLLMMGENIARNMDGWVETFISNSSKTPTGSILGEYYQILQIQSNAPDDGRKHRPKHVEPNWNNKLIYILHLVGYFHSCITMHGFTNVKQFSRWYCVIDEQADRWTDAVSTHTLLIYFVNSAS